MKTVKFKLISQLSRPGLGRIYNQDSVGHTETAVWVIDGISEVNSLVKLKNEDNAVAFFVKHINEYLTKNLNPSNLSIQEILINAVTFVKEKFISELADQSSFEEMPILSLPSASIAIGRTKENRLELFSLGDCVLFLNGKGNILMQNKEINDISKGMIEEIYKQKKQLIGLDHQNFLNHINVKEIDRQTRIKMMNNNQYNVLSFDTSAIQHGIEYNVEIDSTARLLLMTDGFSRIIDHYKLYNNYHALVDKIERHGGDKMYEILRKTERDDLNAEKFPRIKIYDDASLILASFE